MEYSHLRLVKKYKIFKINEKYYLLSEKVINMKNNQKNIKNMKNWDEHKVINLRHYNRSNYL